MGGGEGKGGRGCVRRPMGKGKGRSCLLACSSRTILFKGGLVVLCGSAARAQEAAVSHAHRGGRGRRMQRRRRQMSVAGACRCCMGECQSTALQSTYNYSATVTRAPIVAALKGQRKKERREKKAQGETREEVVDTTGPSEMSQAEASARESRGVSAM